MLWDCLELSSTPPAASAWRQSCHFQAHGAVSLPSLRALAFRTRLPVPGGEGKMLFSSPFRWQGPLVQLLLLLSFSLPWDEGCAAQTPWLLFSKVRRRLVRVTCAYPGENTLLGSSILCYAPLDCHHMEGACFESWFWETCISQVNGSFAEWCRIPTLLFLNEGVTLGLFFSVVPDWCCAVP